MTHSFVYDPDGRLMGEYDSSGSPVAETIWLSPSVANDNQPLGGDDGVGGYAPLAVATGSGGTSALYWVHGNQLGVPIVTTDASGAVAAPPVYTMAGFPGQTHTLSDIYYNRYRDYDSSLGRYIQADPIGLRGGSNPYVYAEDNPLEEIDPSGLVPNPAEATCVEPIDNPICYGGVIVDAVTDVMALVRGVTAAQSVAGAQSDNGDEDCCARLTQEIYQLTDEIDRRFAEQLENKCWLYEFAYDKRHPRLKGTWCGHNEQIAIKQTRLRNLIRQAQIKGCKVPRAAYDAAYRPLPTIPSRYEK